ncbi:MAG: hypothetical protein WC677_03810 [Clostridia bacterium]|jgi:hypothetical protein
MSGTKQEIYPRTTLELLLYILKKIPERLLKALPLTIVIGVLAWLAHTFLLVFQNEGFAADTWLGKNLLNVSDRLVSSTLLWTMIGLTIPLMINFFRKGSNPFSFFASIFMMPKNIIDRNKSTKGRLLPIVCFSWALVLFLNGFLSGVTTALAGGLFMSSVVAFATGSGGIFVQVIRLILTDVQMFALKKSKFNLDNDSVFVIIGSSGIIMLLFGVLKAIEPIAVIFIVLNWIWVAFAILGVVLIINNHNKKVSGQVMFFISIVGLTMLFANIAQITVFADDGGWSEAGGNLWDWLNSPGAFQATAMGLPPAIGGIVGSYVSSILGGMFQGFGMPGAGDTGMPYTGTGNPDDDQPTPLDYTENQVVTNPDGSIIITKPDGSKEAYLPDGTTATKTPEGVETFNFPDGTTTTQYPDGSAVQTEPDGTKTTLTADGVQTTYSPDGKVLTENPDGTAFQDNGDGTTTTLNADGSQTVSNLDGSKTTLHDDGRMTLTDPDGTSKTYDKDNHLTSKTLPNGASGTYGPDGSLTGGTMPDGSPITVNPDGTMTTSIDGVTLTMTPDGSVTGKGTMSDGTQIEMTEDGSIKGILPGGDTVTINKDGELTSAKMTLDDGRKIDMDGETGITSITNDKTGESATINPDGSASYKGPDGSATIGPDGTLSEKYTDGTTTSLTSDGHVNLKQPDGTTWSANPDGTGTVTQPDGTHWTANSDGTTDIAKTDGTKIHVGTDKVIHVTHPDGKTESFLPDK